MGYIYKKLRYISVRGACVQEDVLSLRSFAIDFPYKKLIVRILEVPIENETSDHSEQRLH